MTKHNKYWLTHHFSFVREASFFVINSETSSANKVTIWAKFLCNYEFMKLLCVQRRGGNFRGPIMCSSQTNCNERHQFIDQVQLQQNKTL